MMENKDTKNETFSKGQLLYWEIEGKKGYYLGRYLQIDVEFGIYSFYEVVFVGVHWASFHVGSSEFERCLRNLRPVKKEEEKYYSSKKALHDSFNKRGSSNYSVKLKDGVRLWGYFRGFSLNKDALVFTDVLFLDNREKYVSKIYECNIDDIEKVICMNEFLSDNYAHAMCAYYHAITHPPLNVMDLCLMRNSDGDLWKLCQFAFNRTEKIDYPLFVAVGGLEYYQCIPYEGNEQLLGTSKSLDDGK